MGWTGTENVMVIGFVAEEVPNEFVAVTIRVYVYSVGSIPELSCFGIVGERVIIDDQDETDTNSVLGEMVETV